MKRRGAHITTTSLCNEESLASDLFTFIELEDFR